MKKTFTFDITTTPHGAWAFLYAPSGRMQKKFFRNGYAAAVITAQRWIDGQIDVINEGAAEFGWDVEIIQCHKNRS